MGSEMTRLLKSDGLRPKSERGVGGERKVLNITRDSIAYRFFFLYTWAPARCSLRLIKHQRGDSEQHL